VFLVQLRGSLGFLQQFIKKRKLVMVILSRDGMFDAKVLPFSLSLSLSLSLTHTHIYIPYFFLDFHPKLSWCYLFVQKCVHCDIEYVKYKGNNIMLSVVRREENNNHVLLGISVMINVILVVMGTSQEQ